MDLREKLTFAKATIVSLERNPSRSGLTAILALEAPLTPEIAESLGKKDIVYGRRGVVNQWKGSIGFDEQMRGVDITIGKRGSGWTMRPIFITGFSVKRRDADDGDVTAVLSMRLHLDPEEGEQANTFCEQMNNDPFPLKLDPLQGALFEKGASKQVEAKEEEGDDAEETVN